MFGGGGEKNADRKWARIVNESFPSVAVIGRAVVFRISGGPVVAATYIHKPPQNPSNPLKNHPSINTLARASNPCHLCMEISAVVRPHGIYSIIAVRSLTVITILTVLDITN